MERINSVKSLFSSVRRLENLNYEYTNPFFKSVWFKDFEGLYKNEVQLTNSRLSLDEANNRWTLTTEILGVTQNSLKINQSRGILTITGEKKSGLDIEFFSKYFRIPTGVNTDHIEAQYENNVLTVLLPLIEKKRCLDIPIKL